MDWDTSDVKSDLNTRGDKDFTTLLDVCFYSPILIPADLIFQHAQFPNNYI